MLPQTAHCSDSGPQTPQYQYWPRRCMVCSRLPQPVQTGSEMPTAPARRSATSRLPTTRGAGERPSVSSAGRSVGRRGGTCRLCLGTGRPSTTDIAAGQAMGRGADLAALRQDADRDEGPDWTVGIDAGVVRAHQHAAGARHLPPADVAAQVVATTEVNTGGRTRITRSPAVDRAGRRSGGPGAG
jgi:hypothetical protein